MLFDLVPCVLYLVLVCYLTLCLVPGSAQHRLGQPVCFPLGDRVILEPDEPGVATISKISTISTISTISILSTMCTAGTRGGRGCPARHRVSRVGRRVRDDRRSGVAVRAKVAVPQPRQLRHLRLLRHAVRPQRICARGKANARGQLTTTSSGIFERGTLTESPKLCTTDKKSK